eukprot:TRINITY_DN47557_c0_g1_i1.p1 TRINITY_DN47557_c0_g1~~TRINITY_DN47557_c0_g1_i1.p1  ORF type:complete len:1012 (-),score=237.13 TRINITY_DN47557_c0_g1_i1:68-3103(-)
MRVMSSPLPAVASGRSSSFNVPATNSSMALALNRSRPLSAGSRPGGPGGPDRQRPASAGPGGKGRSGSEVLKVSGRNPTGKKLSTSPPVHVWNQIREPPSISWAERWSTLVDAERDSCSVPAALLSIMQAMWRDAAQRGHKFLCILETCYNCEEHARTTNHNSATYQRYTNQAIELLNKEFPFIRVELLHKSPHYAKRRPLQRRIGAFEVFLFFAKNPQDSCTSCLVHSKLVSLKWPCVERLRARLRAGLPPVVASILEVTSRAWNHEEGLATLREARTWGLGNWDALTSLSERVGAAVDVIEQGQQAFKSGDKAALREALQQGSELQLDDNEMQDWRDDLKRKNMSMLTVKMFAKRFQRNALFFVAVRKLQAAVYPPFRHATLVSAIEKARAADVDEEAVTAAEKLLVYVQEPLRRLQEALTTCSLGELARSIDDLEELGVQDSLLEHAHQELDQTASRARLATESQDYVELQATLHRWHLPTVDEKSGRTMSSNEVADILKADAAREKLKQQIDKAEERFEAKRWDALKSAMDRLTEVHIDEATWERWKSALQREQNFAFIKGVSSAGWELKRQLYATRLKLAMEAEQISVQQLKEATDAAEVHKVDPAEVARARNDLSTVQQRWQSAQDAIARRSVDTAEVMLWKLKRGHIHMPEWSRREGPLWEMVDAVNDAEVAKDPEAMKAAVANWKEDRPGTEHEAFNEKDSPTRLFRFAAERIGELELNLLRQEVNDTLASLKDPTTNVNPEEAKGELRRAAALIRELLKRGWEMTPARSARLLIILNKLKAVGGHEVSVARFCAQTLQTLEGAPRYIFVFDQTKEPSTNDLRPAVVAAAQFFKNHAEDAFFGAVAYGPVEVVHDLTSDFQAFADALESHPVVSIGSRAAGKRTTAQAYRTAKELFKIGKGQDRDHPLVVVHIMQGTPDNTKDAHKVCRGLQALGVTVFSLGVGKNVKVDSLARVSSEGFVFKLEAFDKLLDFLQDSFQEVDRVLKASRSKSPEEILSMLESA